MPEFPYFKSPTAWMPSQEIVPEIPIVRSDSFFAVIAPEGRTQIQDYEEYRSLLEARIRWLIQQAAEDQQVELARVYHLIQRRLTDEILLHGMELWTPNQADWSPESWARALADSARMRAIFRNEIMTETEYPLALANDPEINATVQEAQTLYEWLNQFSRN